MNLQTGIAVAMRRNVGAVFYCVTLLWALTIGLHSGVSALTVTFAAIDI